MDTSGMDMSAMGGMEMAGEGPFRPVNERIARGLWYIVVGTVGILIVARALSLLQSRQRRGAQQRDPNSIPSRPRRWISQGYATATAMMREISYPQPIYFTGEYNKYFSPLPIGRWLILILYWMTLLCLLWSGTILGPSNAMYAYKWEKVGFRAAWVSVAQIPFIYLLSCKFNPISILTGISYERFNWLHRWAARTVFLTTIIHWSFFFREWWLADFVTLEIEMMPMVKYGFGAWATIGWMILSGFGFFRSLCYEIFVAQHICAAATLIWLLHTHLPAYARYYIYMALAFVGFDWSMRIMWVVLRNTHNLDQVRSSTLGYRVRLEALPGAMTRLTIDGPAFDWKAGQHAYISIPRLRPFELHPFTIANAAVAGPPGKDERLTMVIKAHSGFSKRLYKAAVDNKSESRTYRALLSGPWGCPPDLRHFESIVLIACSSGASFTTPLLHDLARKPNCARQLIFHWIIRSEDHLSWFEQDLMSLVDAARYRNVRLRIRIHVTQSFGRNSSEQQSAQSKNLADSTLFAVDSSSENTWSSGSVASIGNENASLAPLDGRGTQRRLPTLPMTYGSRPTVESMIRPAVETALGETAVVVCGGLTITAQARTFVAALSDERAVHKGTGAQGIFLFTETYGW